MPKRCITTQQTFANHTLQRICTLKKGNQAADMVPSTKATRTSNNIDQVIGDSGLAPAVVFELKRRNHVIGILTGLIDVRKL